MNAIFAGCVQNGQFLSLQKIVCSVVDKETRALLDLPIAGAATDRPCGGAAVHAFSLAARSNGAQRARCPL